MLNNVNQIISQVQKMQKEVENILVEAEGEKGAVKIVMNGKQELVSCKLNMSLLQNMEEGQIEDLLIKTLNNATNKSRAAVKDKMSESTGLNLNSMLSMFS